MNIAFVTTEFVSEGNFGGGLASYINNISKVLADMGHHIIIITPSECNQTIQWDENIIVERVFIASKYLESQYHWKSCIVSSFYLNKRLKQVVRAGKKVDVVQYTNYRALGLFRTKIPSVVRISSDMLLWRNANIENFNVEKVYKCEKIGDYLEDIAMKRADKIYGPSKLLADIIGRRIKQNIEVIESPFIQNKQELVFDTYHENLEKKQYILTFSSLSRMKGLQVIADAIYEILRQNPNLYYALAGSDRGIHVNGKRISTVAYIKEKAKEFQDRIVYLGVVERAELYPVIKGAELIVLPSRIDNLPNSCIEAMYLEKVVIGTNGASYEQLIENEYNGFLFNRDSPDSLIATIKKAIMLSSEEKRMMEKRAKERTKQMSPEKIGMKTIAMYEATIRQKGILRK